jgi:hypothetical protein
MFQLTAEVFENLMSQFAISNKDSLRSQNAILEKVRGKHRKYLPYAFTEQGVAMLSAVLKSETAVKMSVQIVNAFVAMRRFLINNAGVFQRLDKLELNQIDTNNKVNLILDAMQSKDLEPKQGIFYDGQIFDDYKFAADLIRKANSSIILIDNYIDGKDVYHIGASPKDLGKKWFTFSKMDKSALELLENIKKVGENA